MAENKNEVTPDYDPAIYDQSMAQNSSSGVQDSSDDKYGLNPSSENPAGTATSANILGPDESQLLPDAGDSDTDTNRNAGPAGFALGTLENVPKSGWQFIKDAGDAILSPIQSAKGIGALVAGGVEKAVGMTPQTPTDKGIGAFFGGNHVANVDAFLDLYKNRYIGKDKNGNYNLANTLYNDPVGVLADLSTLLFGGEGAVKGLAKVAKAADAAETASKLGTLGSALGTAATVTDPMTPITNLIAKPLLNAALPSAQKLYTEALKPGMEQKIEGLTGAVPDYPAVVKTALANKIPVSMLGIQKVKALIDSLHDRYMDLVYNYPQAEPVSPSAVAAKTARSKSQFATAAPTPNQNAIDAVANDFMAQHTVTTPGIPASALTDASGQPLRAAISSGTTEVPIPLAIAQDLKTKTYAQLRDMYGEQGRATVEATKDLAFGLKEEIAKSLSDISGVDVSSLTSKESKFIGLDQALQRAVAKNMTKPAHTVGNAAIGAVGGTLTGHAGVGTALGLMKGIISDPEVKSKLAIAINTVQQRRPLAAGRPSMGLALRAVDQLQKSYYSYTPTEAPGVATPGQGQDSGLLPD